jgi:ABC-type amino acid transport substrate-binding protein
MKRRIALFVMLALVAVTAAPAFAQDGTLDKIKRSGVLTIGTRTGSPPFAFVNKNNEWVGFTVDLVEQLVKPAVEKEWAGRSRSRRRNPRRPPASRSSRPTRSI